MRRCIYAFCRLVAPRRNGRDGFVGPVHRPIICNGFENSGRNMYPRPLAAGDDARFGRGAAATEGPGLTQTALARLSNVSQSTIVKIEKRQMNPSYDVVRRVMASLQAELKRQEKKALVEQIQTRKVQYVEAKIPLATAVD